MLTSRALTLSLHATLTACLAATSLPCRAQSAAVQDLASFPRAALVIVHHEAAHRSRTYHFDVWVADTPARAQQGLMFVSDLPESAGMVFPLVPPRIERMWMKNTYIELDMLFVDAAGRISKITPRAQPLKLDTLSSDLPVSAVVELRGGEAAKLALKVGDLVSWAHAAAPN
ncbi:MAG TPA: DUF192 domain-containing protein [Steroidobacteraceae bacterium]